jgi:hypothetical protein
LNGVEHVKKFTLKTFFKNQYNRSRDLVGVFINKKAYKFYVNPKRKNIYAKTYLLRVPISWSFLLFLALFLIIGYYSFLFCAGFLLLASVFIEMNFLKFCLRQKGIVFFFKCVPFYFVDGLISGIGVLRGFLDIPTGGRT